MAKSVKSTSFKISLISNDNNKVILSKGFSHKDEFNNDVLKSVFGEELISSYVDRILSEYRLLDIANISSTPYLYKSDDISNIPFEKFTFTIVISQNGIPVLSKGFRTLQFSLETRKGINLSDCLFNISKDLQLEIEQSKNADYRIKGLRQYKAYDAYSIPRNYFNKKWIKEMIKANSYLSK